jgi:hypothetical protein
MDMKDDNKSMKSFKSKGSIKSEIHDGFNRKKVINTIQH